MSMYAQYIKERENVELIQRDWGFVTYKVEPEYIFIQDMFVVPEERQNGRGVQLEAEVITLAKKLDFKFIIASVDERANFAETMKNIMSDLNYKKVARDGSLIYYKKEV